MMMMPTKAKKQPVAMSIEDAQVRMMTLQIVGMSKPSGSAERLGSLQIAWRS